MRWPVPVSWGSEVAAFGAVSSAGTGAAMGTAELADAGGADDAPGRGEAASATPHTHTVPKQVPKQTRQVAWANLASEGNLYARETQRCRARRGKGMRRILVACAAAWACHIERENSVDGGPPPWPVPQRAQVRIRVLLPNRLSMRSTANKAVWLRRSSAGLSSITSRLARRPVSAIISMHSCASR
jgi:hypothetical protein